MIVAGMIEKGMFYSEYAAMNEEGSTVHGFIEVIGSYWNLNLHCFSVYHYISQDIGLVSVSNFVFLFGSF